MGGGTAVTATSRSANYDNTTTMQNHCAGGRIGYGGALAYELCGVYPMNEELKYQEGKRGVSLRDGLAELSKHIDQIGVYNFEALCAEQEGRCGQCTCNQCAKQESNYGNG